MLRRLWCFRYSVSVLLLFFAASVFALDPTPEELELRDIWLQTRFYQNQKSLPLANSIEVLENNDPLRQNTGNGNKIKIGKVVYEKGLYAHASSRLKIYLSGPAKKFTSFVGVDNNATNGQGSVKFSVEVKNKIVFETPILRGGNDPVRLDVNLDGADSFFLNVSPTEDGISCDQSDWAEAQVTMADGTVLDLGDFRVWGKYVTTEPIDFPFSFRYNGKSSREFLKSWKREKGPVSKENGRETYTITFSEPNGCLVVYCDMTLYSGYPQIEWKLRFKNNSDIKTPVIENIKAIDTVFLRKSFSPRSISGWDPNWGAAKRFNEQNEFVLHHAVGSPCRQDDYMPLTTSMTPGLEKTIATSGGRSSNSDLPYFNIGAGNQGWIVVIGWPGQWSAQFKRVGDTGLLVSGGQELTHFYLEPKEEVRTPCIVVQPWQRSSWFEAQNVWRQWMIQFNVHRQPDGSIIDHHLAACSSHFFAEMTQADSKKQMTFIDRYLEEKIQLDYWWMDAGWYPCDGQWPKTGTWEIDQTRFPGGFRPITDHGRAKNVKSIVWFEPERVHPDSWLAKNHPEWLLKAEGSSDLLNLGNEEARNWLTNHIDAFIKREGIDLYRQDFNMDPILNWRKNDVPDRQGINEIRHITGYLAYWDALQKRNPGLRIDSCASGGRRNDLETMRRAVPLLRSDYLLEPVGQQIHQYGSSFWIPFEGTGGRAFDDYLLRSHLSPYINLCYDARVKDDNWELVRRNMKIWREELVPYYAGDYYPLTRATADEDVWIGWQYNDPKRKSGVIQMFRRIDSTMTSGMFPLFGLEKDAQYLFRDVDSGKTFTGRGKDLMEAGCPLTISKAPYAAIFHYEKVK